MRTWADKAAPLTFKAKDACPYCGHVPKVGQKVRVQRTMETQGPRILGVFHDLCYTQHRSKQKERARLRKLEGVS